MTKMSTLERAVMIAAEAHAGQVDKAGEPYLLHPLRVMLQMGTIGERIVAVLHDVVEDSVWTLEGLAEEGFAPVLLEAIESVTRRPKEDYDQFILRAARNTTGCRVKLADLRDNCDLSRIVNPSEIDFKRIARYRQAIGLLEEKIGTILGPARTCNPPPDLDEDFHPTQS